MSHRLGICAALADGTSTLENNLDCADTRRTAGVLAAAGAVVLAKGKGACGARKLEIIGIPLGKGNLLYSNDIQGFSCCVGDSGTTCRFLTPVLAAIGISGTRFHVFGSERMDERPIEPLLKVLQQQGCQFEFLGREWHTPFIIIANGINGGRIEIDCADTNQYLSGLLLAAPLGKTPVTIFPTGRRIASWKYVLLTLDAMEMFGVKVVVSTRRKLLDEWAPIDWRKMEEMPKPGYIKFDISPSTYKPSKVSCDADWSTASYFLAAGALGPMSVQVEGLDKASLQGDRVITQILKKMGATIVTDEVCVTAKPASAGELCGVEWDMSSYPDLVPTVAVLGAIAYSGPTKLYGVEHLELKESNRIQAIIQELDRIGATAKMENGTLIIQQLNNIQRANLRNTSIFFSAHNDHRLAMSLSLLELIGITVKLDNTDCVAKSFPQFWEQWDKIRQLMATK